MFSNIEKQTQIDAFLWAASNNQTATVWSYRTAMPVNVTNTKLQTVFHVTAERGHLEIMKLLETKEANLDAIDMQGMTPLLYAVKNGKISVIKWLIEHRVDVNYNMRADFLRQESLFGTALHIAVKFDKRMVVKALIEAGARVNATDQFNRTPLHYAVCKKERVYAQVLLIAGADVNAIDSQNITPCIYAMQFAIYQCIEPSIFILLAEYGALINHQNDRQETALHFAARSSILLYQVLIMLGANQQIKDKDGKTPVDLARNSETYPTYHLELAVPSGTLGSGMTTPISNSVQLLQMPTIENCKRVTQCPYLWSLWESVRCTTMQILHKWWLESIHKVYMNSSMYYLVNKMDRLASVKVLVLQYLYGDGEIKTSKRLETINRDHNISNDITKLGDADSVVLKRCLGCINLPLTLLVNRITMPYLPYEHAELAKILLTMPRLPDIHPELASYCKFLVAVGIDTRKINATKV